MDDWEMGVSSVVSVLRKLSMIANVSRQLDTGTLEDEREVTISGGMRFAALCKGQEGFSILSVNTSKVPGVRCRKPSFIT